MSQLDLTFALFEALRCYQLFTFRHPDTRKALELVCRTLNRHGKPCLIEVRGDRLREDRRPLTGTEIVVMAKLISKHDLPAFVLHPGLALEEVAALLVLLESSPQKSAYMGGGSCPLP